LAIALDFDFDHFLAGGIGDETTDESPSHQFDIA
jgi:hypothetical protein